MRMSIHENALLKKQVVKLEEKLILKEMKEKEHKEKIKDLETQIKVLHKQLADKKGFKLREEGYGEKRKEKYDEIRAKYGLRSDPNNPFEEDEPAEKPVKKSLFSKLTKK